MILFNPTQGEIRSDRAGSGHFGTPRGDRFHHGLDLTIPSENVWSPIGGKIVRMAYPYAGDPRWMGVLIVGETFNVKLFYFVPDDDLIGQAVTRGQRIGTPQQISQKYPDQGMTDHVHLEVAIRPFNLIDEGGEWIQKNVKIDPAILLGL